MSNEEKIWGTKWLKFYIYWRFPIGFVLGGFMLISELVDATQLRIPIVSIAVAIDVAMYIFRIVVFSYMFSMNERGYRLNNYLLVFEGLIMGLSNGLETSSETPILIIIVCLVLSFLIWIWPNYVYFKHRKHLFNGEKITSSNSITTFPPAIPSKENKSFICTVCNQTRTGWYQTCPNCGAVGTMVKVEDPQPEVKTLAHSVIPQPAVSDSNTSLGNVQTMTANFCRFCGYKLPSDSLFCSNCGKKV